MWTGSERAPGPGRPPTLFTELLVVGGMQKVAARVAFCVPGAPTRTIGSRKQLRNPPVQIWFGLHVEQLPDGGGLQSVSVLQPRNVSTLQNWSNGPALHTPSFGLGSDGSGEQTVSLH